MIACVDVDYRDHEAFAACVVADEWTSATAREEHVVRIDEVAPYEPGRFYLRELPCLRAVLARVTVSIEVVIVDGQVWLDEDRPGLGARLYEALGATIPVVGVAKTEYRGATRVIEVCRGESKSPLYVSAIGMDASDAAAKVRAMHGPYRMPTLLARVDRVARDA
ncbi:endonuclease V [Sandaracinus amylolyticus]|uniref:endonuclease V n=1 Tax=Sandaracinus amylolyticus TaxID=927083 RepID=UPI001EFFE613|nr:endonuclease V [Sandaracinus amylolyticus]